MKKFISLTLSLGLTFMLFTACGASRAEQLMDRYAELANSYSALSASVAKQNDTALLGSFSSLGIELTDIATELAKDGDTLTNEALDAISSALDSIEAKLSEIPDNEAQ